MPHAARCDTFQQQNAQLRKAPPEQWMMVRFCVTVVLCSALLVCCLLMVIQKHCYIFFSFVAAAEAAFFVHYWCICVPFFQRLAHKNGPDEHDAKYVKAQLIQQLMRLDDVMEVMESWFLEVQPGDVRKDNLKELFAYAIWYKSLGEMETEGLIPELEDLMRQLEHKFGVTLPPGFNSKLSFMSHLWEPLRHIYRPLLVYVVMELLWLLCHVVLLVTGFKPHCLDGITYYTYKLGPQQVAPGAANSLVKKSRRLEESSTHDDTGATDAESASTLPIVFLHGVGAGLLPYLVMIFRLAALGQPMLLPDCKHVSMRLVSRIPTVDEMAETVAAMLAVHGQKRAAVVAHSYGTMVASRLALKHPDLVHSMCLTDPVCFAMYMPNLLRNFLYTSQSCGCWLMDMTLRLIASELHCCANFSRKFFWSSINLWDEHIPARTLVALGGQDVLSPNAHVHRWLRSHTHAQVLYEPSMHHAGLLLDMSWQATIVATFAELMKQQTPESHQPAADATATVSTTSATTKAARPPQKDCSNQEALGASQSFNQQLTAVCASPAGASVDSSAAPQLLRRCHA